MRDLLFKCPNCAASLAFDRKLAGRELSCPACKADIAVPIPDASFRCPACDAELHAPSDLAGRLQCPACDGELLIEDTAPAEAPRADRPKLRLKDRPIEPVPPTEPYPCARLCPQCQAELDSDAVLCVQCGMDLRTGSRIQTDGLLAMTGHHSDMEDCGHVPWWRRSGVNGAMVLGSLIFTPLLWFVCWNCLTGEIYYNKRDKDGRRKTWGRANRVAAVILLLLEAAGIVWSIVVAWGNAVHSSEQPSVSTTIELIATNPAAEEAPALAPVAMAKPQRDRADLPASASGKAWADTHGPLPSTTDSTRGIPSNGNTQRSAAFPHPSAEEQALAKAAYDLFGTLKNDSIWAGDKDLLFVAKVVRKMKARTAFPTPEECDAVLDACQELSGKALTTETRRAVDGTKVLATYERDMMALGYRRCGAVFVDQTSIQARQQAAEVAQLTAQNRKQGIPSRQGGRMERNVKSFGNQKDAETYADLNNKYFQCQKYHVKRQDKVWVVCASEQKEVVTARRSPATTASTQLKDFGYVDPYPGIPRSSAVVVESFTTLDAAFAAKQRRQTAVNAPYDALEEQVVNAGNAVAVAAPQPQCDVRFNPTTKMWDLIIMRP